MTTVAIIQARMGSRRLPGKVMMNVAGKPLLQHVIDRVRAVEGLDRIVLATSIAEIDRPVYQCGKVSGVDVFAGSEDDVLDRYYQAARLFHADVVMRVTGDCPLLDPKVSGSVLSRFDQGDVDYVSNVHPPTFPDGLDTEVFSMQSLETAWRTARKPAEREHVTAYLWDHPERFKLANVETSPDLSSLRWTVDEPLDLELIRAVYQRLPSGDYDHSVVLSILRMNPGLSNINGSIVRNQGYSRSVLSRGKR